VCLGRSYDGFERCAGSAAVSYEYITVITACSSLQFGVVMAVVVSPSLARLLARLLAVERDGARGAGG
jgi:hypothetical protein